MKKGSRMFMIAASLLLLAFYSCNSVNSEKQGEFYYYPEKNVYYNVAKNIYLYSIDGAKTWQAIAASIDESNNPALGQRIVIYSNNDSVWLDNVAHRSAAGGKLYHITAASNEEDTATGWVKEKKLVKKPVTTKNQRPKDKPKKGIGKFFEKLFGKHKNDTTQQ